jgi:hypothetical protein
MPLSPQRCQSGSSQAGSLSGPGAPVFVFWEPCLPEDYNGLSFLLEDHGDKG